MSVWWCSDCTSLFAAGPICPRCGKPGGVAQPMVPERELERALADLASNHVDRFVNALSRTNATPAETAHALWLLAREAERQRERLITPEGP